MESLQINVKINKNRFKEMHKKYPNRTTTEIIKKLMGYRLFKNAEVTIPE